MPRIGRKANWHDAVKGTFMHRQQCCSGSTIAPQLGTHELRNVGPCQSLMLRSWGSSPARRYSLAAMLLWDAQFGDYANVAQASLDLSSMQQVPSWAFGASARQDGEFADKALATVPQAARATMERCAVALVVLSPKSLLRCSASYYSVAGMGSGKPAR